MPGKSTQPVSSSLLNDQSTRGFFVCQPSIFTAEMSRRMLLILARRNTDVVTLTTVVVDLASRGRGRHGLVPVSCSRLYPVVSYSPRQVVARDVNSVLPRPHSLILGCRHYEPRAARTRSKQYFAPTGCGAVEPDSELRGRRGTRARDGESLGCGASVDRLEQDGMLAAVGFAKRYRGSMRNFKNSRRLRSPAVILRQTRKAMVQMTPISRTTKPILSRHNCTAFIS